MPAVLGVRRLRVVASTAIEARLIQSGGGQCEVLRACEGVAQFPDKGDHPEAYGESDPARDDYVLHTPVLRADAPDAPLVWRPLLVGTRGQHAAQRV